MKGEAGEVLREGEMDEGKDKEKGRGGEEENKNNILIIIILGGRPTL